jgi:membrane dipeptidase
MTYNLNLLLLSILTFCTTNLLAGNIEKKAARIHGEVLTIDSHNDTPLRMMVKGFDINARHDPRKEYTKVDFPRMKEGGLDGAFFGAFVSQGPRDQESYEKIRQKMLILIDTIHNAVNRYPEVAGFAVSPDDAYRLKAEGKRSVFIGIENGYAIGKDLSLVGGYYRLGARYITLCHTKNNDICDSSTDTVEFSGLSRFGKSVVAEMNHEGMMIDISHASDKAFYDVLATTKAPVIASHSCARALCNNSRNLSDEMLRALAKNGGVIQMCILSDYVRTPEPNPPRDSLRKAVRERYHDWDNLTEEQIRSYRKEMREIDARYPAKMATVGDVADHIDHIVKVAGIDHVGIGTDFDGGGGVEGCYDVSGMGNITLELVKRGYSKEEISKIWGANLMRVLAEVTKISRNYDR